MRHKSDGKRCLRERRNLRLLLRSLQIGSSSSPEKVDGHYSFSVCFKAHCLRFLLFFCYYLYYRFLNGMFHKHLFVVYAHFQSTLVFVH